jgi:hypothetical protein
LGSAGAQSAVTIGSQALPLTGVVDQLQLNVRARPTLPKRHQNRIPLPRPGGQSLAVPRPQSLCPGDDDHLDPIQERTRDCYKIWAGLRNERHSGEHQTGFGRRVDPYFRHAHQGAPRTLGRGLGQHREQQRRGRANQHGRAPA